MAVGVLFWMQKVKPSPLGLVPLLSWKVKSVVKDWMLTGRGEVRGGDLMTTPEVSSQARAVELGSAVHGEFRGGETAGNS